MNKMYLMISAAALACGCVNTRYIEPPPQAPRSVAAVTTPAVGSVSRSIGKNVSESTKGRAVESAKRLRVLVSLDDGNDADKPSSCKRTLQTNLEGALSSAGFRVVYAKPAEILVYGTLRARKVNERGTRVSWAGEADIEITRAPEVDSVNGQVMRDVVAKRRFDVASGDARSNDEAQRKMSDRLSSNISDFCASSVMRIAKKMSYVELKVINAWQNQDAAGYPTLFTQKISSLKGVYSCKVTSVDNALRTMTAEVIYDGAEFPDGFMNRLCVMPELNIIR